MKRGDAVRCADTCSLQSISILFCQYKPLVPEIMTSISSLVSMLLLIFEIHANPDAKRLYDDLMSSYNSMIRPVGNNSDHVTVKIGLKLSQLIDVVSRDHYIQLI